MLQSRQGADLTGAFPDIAAAATELGEALVLGGARNASPTCAPRYRGSAPRPCPHGSGDSSSSGWVTRTAYPETPPRVEYQLTPEGTRLHVVFDAMTAWAEQVLPPTGSTDR
jgi:hypothetical protein